jgi:hypothetical protein
MSLKFKFCSVCKERRLDMNVNSDQICKRCNSDKNQVKLFSPENNMDPQKLPTELSGLTNLLYLDDSFFPIFLTLIKLISLGRLGKI